MLGVFLFWGWESTLAVNEETENPDKTPGRAAVISTVLLLITYLSVSMGVVSVGGTGDGLLDFSEEGLEAGSADDVFTPLAESIGLWMVILIQLAIVVSALSSSQTTIMPTTRGMLSMGAYRALPESFASVHPYYRSPGFSTAVMGIAAIIYYVGMSVISQNILYDSIYSIGLAITFYYALTGFSSVWYFRHDLTNSGRDLFFKGLFPLFGALGLGFVFVRSAMDMYDPANNETTLLGVGGAFVLGIGGLVAGAVIMVLLSARKQQRPVLPRRDPRGRHPRDGARGRARGHGVARGPGRCRRRCRRGREHARRARGGARAGARARAPARRGRRRGTLSRAAAAGR